MSNQLNDVVVIDAVRTAFGRAGEKGIFWNTRADELQGGPSAFNMGMTAENPQTRYGLTTKLSKLQSTQYPSQPIN